MTRQYLSGELSLRLGQLEQVAGGSERSRAAARLRVEAEQLSSGSLVCLLTRGLLLGDEICMAALEEGNWPLFLLRLEACSELWEFGVCSRLIDAAVLPEVTAWPS